MIIDRNGFYKLSKIKEESIIISPGVIVSFYDDGKKDRKIFLSENSRVDFYGLIKDKENYNIEFFQKGKNSKLRLKYLLLSQDGSNLNTKIHSKIMSDNSTSNISIISIAGNNGNIELDGILEIDKGFKKIKGTLLEQNLFIGSHGKIRSIPTLLVGSDDVEARHACKIEKISDEKVFYLRSRGINKKNSLELIIESYIKSIFSCLSMIDEKFYNELFISILKSLK